MKVKGTESGCVLEECVKDNYCANGLNLSNLIGNYLVNFMYLVTNSFDKYLNRIGKAIAFIER